MFKPKKVYHINPFEKKEDLTLLTAKEQAQRLAEDYKAKKWANKDLIKIIDKWAKNYEK